MDFDKELKDIYPWILHLAGKFCRCREDAEDLANDIIYKLLVNRDQFVGDKSLKPWCLAVMRNVYITKYNRQSLVTFVDYGSVPEFSSSCSSEYLTLFDDTLTAIKRCIRKSHCMDCVIYFAKGYSYNEISEFLNIPIGTVRSRISYGRKLLFQELNS